MENGLESNPTRRRLSLLILLLITFLFSGCIEHTYFYSFDLDGNCDFSYQARGDSLDIYDSPESLPDSLFFHLETWTEVDTGGAETFIIEAKRYLCGDSLPRTMSLKRTPLGDVLLQHPARLHRTALFFISLYSFKGTFEGRRRTSRGGDQWDYIPEECRQIESDEDTTLTDEERRFLEEKFAAGMLIWSAERYKLRVREIIDRVREQHPEIAIPQAWVDSALVEADSLVDSYIASLEWESLDFAELEWWDELKPETNRILLENLNMIGDATLQMDIVDVGDLLEMRHQVTEDLMDESFGALIHLPGYIVSCNTDSTAEGVLVWDFDGEDIGDEDYIIKALSFHVHYDRVIGALVLILVVFLGIQFKRPPSNRTESPEQSTPPRSVPPTGHG